SLLTLFTSLSDCTRLAKCPKVLVRIIMPKIYTVTFKDYETQPDLIEKAAALHGIPAEMLLKRFISRALDEYREPMKDISEFESLEDFFKGNGLRK
ncbi:hypothetical protein, partial [Rheinheimera sp.]